MTDSNVANIKAVFQLATPLEIANGKAWYQLANSIALTIAGDNGIEHIKAIGALAALSPRNKWSRNIQDAQSLISAYRAAGSVQAALTKVCTFGANKAKAIKILELNDPSFNDILAILSGPKLKEFASCIYGLNDICIDGHAYCIWNGGRTSLKDVPAIGVKLRRSIKADYLEAAKDLGLTGYETQAITWVAWRRIHGVA